MASNDPHPTSLGLCLPDPFRASDVRLIPQFDGSPSQSVTEWFEKLELVCRLRKVEDVACVVPLRLSGGVFAVYLQLPDEDKKSVVKVKAALLAAFAMDTFAAYDEFSCRKLRNGESPDVFLADLWRLASLFGGIPEKAMMCAFVAGLPESFKHKLYLVMSVQRLCRAYAWVQRRPGRQRTLGSADAMNALRCGYQKKAWMNVEAFKDWFKTIFIPEVKRHQSSIGKTGKVLLLVDNTPAHPSVQQLDEVDELVTIKFLPPNVTPLIQPMDQGVIQTSKRHYRKQLLRQLLLANEIR
uniref:DDE-1 domain-containing protein n=1 Tax=Trichuris muris TaxID=70415 RepID=A0A5S6Q4F3_TRIMR